MVLLGAVLQAVPAGAVSAVSSAADPTWGTGPGEDGRAGRVLAVAEAGGLVYLGGDFTSMAPPDSPGRDRLVVRQYLAALEVGSGALAPWDPVADGTVRALLPSPDGRRLYVGGEFDSIAGQPARGLTALDPATGAPDPTFQPPVLTSVVRALALSPDGKRLYLGGDFTHVAQPNGTSVDRPHLAAVDAATGALLDWLPPDDEGGHFYGQTGMRSEVGDGGVYAVAVSGDGRTVHVGGTFLAFGGRAGLLSLDAATGRATSWQAKMERPVFGLSLSPADGHRVYAATGGAGGRLYGFDPGGKTTPALEVKTDGDAMAVVASVTTVYLLGHYDYIVSAKSTCYQYCPDGVPRRHLAAFDAWTGALDPWDPTANTPTGPYTGAAGGSHLYVGGEFTNAGGRSQPGIAQFPGVP